GMARRNSGVSSVGIEALAPARLRSVRLACRAKHGARDRRRQQQWLGPPVPEQTEPTGAESPRERANRAQLDASDPAVSVFVAASAGSGKTKLLTDRLLRLMLAGAKPERIQCLTFTKAAAAEMAVRLQHTLGRWVTFDDARLDHALRDLSIEPTPELRQRARALFAQVLDLPGGMRIGTIHAFCQSLL